jgi:hypothetical protein
MTESMQWAHEIRIAVVEYLKTHSFVPLDNFRLTQAVYLDTCPLGKQPTDQANLSGEEFAMYQAAIGFTFGYQAQSN